MLSAHAIHGSYIVRKANLEDDSAVDASEFSVVDDSTY